MTEQFTPEEIETAKAVRAQIIKEGPEELKSIYMAGEICMWDHMRKVPPPPATSPEETAEKMLKSHKDFPSEGFSEYMNGYYNGCIHGLKYPERPPARVVTDEEINEKYPFLLGSASVFNIDMVRRREGARWMRSLLSQDEIEAKAEEGADAAFPFVLIPGNASKHQKYVAKEKVKAQVYYKAGFLEGAKIHAMNNGEDLIEWVCENQFIRASEDHFWSPQHQCVLTKKAAYQLFLKEKKK